GRLERHRQPLENGNVSILKAFRGSTSRSVGLPDMANGVCVPPWFLLMSEPCWRGLWPRNDERLHFSTGKLVLQVSHVGLTEFCPRFATWSGNFRQSARMSSDRPTLVVLLTLLTAS